MAEEIAYFLFPTPSIYWSFLFVISNLSHQRDYLLHSPYSWDTLSRARLECDSFYILELYMMLQYMCHWSIVVYPGLHTNSHNYPSVIFLIMLKSFQICFDFPWFFHQAVVACGFYSMLSLWELKIGWLLQLFRQFVVLLGIFLIARNAVNIFFDFVQGMHAINMFKSFASG